MRLAVVLAVVVEPDGALSSDTATSYILGKWWGRMAVQRKRFSFGLLVAGGKSYPAFGSILVFLLFTIPWSTRVRRGNTRPIDRRAFRTQGSSSEHRMRFIGGAIYPDSRRRGRSTNEYETRITSESRPSTVNNGEYGGFRLELKLVRLVRHLGISNEKTQQSTSLYNPRTTDHLAVFIAHNLGPPLPLEPL